MNQDAAFSTNVCTFQRTLLIFQKVLIAILFKVDLFISIIVVHSHQGVPVYSGRINVEVNATIHSENLQVLLDLGVHRPTARATRAIAPHNVAVLVNTIPLIGVMTITLIPILHLLEDDDLQIVKLALGQSRPVVLDVINNVHVNTLLHFFEKSTTFKTLQNYCFWSNNLVTTL